MLNAEILAITASLCFAGSEVTMKRGLTSVSVIGGVLITLGSALPVLVLAVILEPPRSFDPRGLALFALAGLAAPGAARWGAAHGVNRLGPSVSVPIAQGTRPLLAIAGAVAFLGEPLEPHRAVGLCAILIGGWQLSRRYAGSNPGPSPGESRGWDAFVQPGIAFPLIAGASYAVQDVLAKQALNFIPFPAFGALIGMACALAAWGTTVTVAPRLRDQIDFGRHKLWLIASGLLSGLALISLFNALKRGEISLVSPIIATQPLAVLLLSRVFLREEHLRRRTVLAACGVVVGTAIVTL